MTPPRGIVKPTILAALAGLTVALATLGAMQDRHHKRRVCGRHPDNHCHPDCDPRRRVSP